MLFKKSVFLLFCFCPAFFVKGQTDSISVSKIYTHLSVLASDSFKGRGNFSPGLIKAADYIALEFAKANLQPLMGFFDFQIPFNAGTGKTISRDKLMWNKNQLQQDRFFYFTTEKFPESKSLTDFRVIEIKGKLADTVLYQYWNEADNILIWWNQNTSKDTKEVLSKLPIPGISPFSNVLVVVSNERPETVEIETNPEYRKNILFNIVGVLPGKTKPGEIVIFSAHYDHIGVNRSLKSDSIFNGANDNASGVAAMLSLAEYYSFKNDNERTILFCAFAGEELGMLGSYDFAELMKPTVIKAMLNLEMLGKNSTGSLGEFFITGEKQSNLKNIFSKEFKKQKEKIANEPEGSDLFFRSDNFPFAKKGVPAHSIMTSDDRDPCYHKPCDDIKDMNPLNIAAVIENIITGCSKIISGEETPSRIRIEN
jgi:hypothetical protein